MKFDGKKQEHENDEVEIPSIVTLQFHLDLYVSFSTVVLKVRGELGRKKNPIVMCMNDGGNFLKGDFFIRLGLSSNRIVTKATTLE